MSIFLRDTTQADKALVMAWRSNAELYQGFYSQKKPLEWQEHSDWWDSRNRDWRQFIIVLQEDTHLRDIGVVTIGQLDHWNPEVGYYIGELTLWGRGYGREAVRLACDWLRGKGYEYVHTTVLKSNFRSIMLLHGLGFEMAGNARAGELRFERKL